MPGVPDDAGRGRPSRPGRTRTSPRSRRWRATTRTTRSSSSTTRRCSSAAATSPTRPRAFEQAKKAAATRTTRSRPTTCSTRSSSTADGPGYPVFEPTRPDPLLERGSSCSARSTSTRPSSSTPGREAAPERRRGAGRGRGRPVRRGQPRRRVLAPRAARQALPAQPDRALPPRAAARLDRPARRRRSASSRLRVQLGPKTPIGPRGGRVPARPRRARRRGRPRKMSRLARRVRPAPLRELRIPGTSIREPPATRVGELDGARRVEPRTSRATSRRRRLPTRTTMTTPLRRARRRDAGRGRLLLARSTGCRPRRSTSRRRARVLDRLAAALPEGHRQGRSADRGAGGRAREADRARRPPREAGDGRGEPAPRRLDREALPQPGAAVPRPDPGGDDRPRARRREVRLAQGLQVLDLRDLVDPPGGRACARRQGAHDPHAGPRRREAEQDPARRSASCAPSGAASRRTPRSPPSSTCRSRRSSRSAAPRRRRSRSRSRSATTTSRSSGTSSRTRPRRCPTRSPTPRSAPRR